MRWVGRPCCSAFRGLSARIIAGVEQDWLLALETSGRGASVAVARGAALLAECSAGAGQRGQGGVVSLIAAALRTAGIRPAEVGAVAWSRGPGSFTGLRIAATIAQHLQSAVGCRVIGIDSLAVMARNALRPDLRDRAGALIGLEAAARVVTILDAKRGQVYGAAYERRAGGATGAGLSERIAPGLYDPLELFTKAGRPLVILGEGIDKHQAACAASGAAVAADEFWLPRAAELVPLAWERLAARSAGDDPIRPMYVRPPECEEVYEARRAAARAKGG